jgi:hypothetical protein
MQDRLKEIQNEEMAIQVRRQRDEQCQKDARQLKLLADTQQLSGILLYRLLFFGVFNYFVFADCSIGATQAAFAACGLGVKCQPVRVSEESHDNLSHQLMPYPRVNCTILNIQQLCRRTKRTFPAAIDGHRVAQVIFTWFILHILGICSVQHLS